MERNRPSCTGILAWDRRGFFQMSLFIEVRQKQVKSYPDGPSKSCKRSSYQPFTQASPLLMAQNMLNKIEWKKFLRVLASFSSCCSLPELSPNQVILLPRQQPAMSLTNRGVALSLCVYTKVRVETTACFQRDKTPADVHNKAGPRGLMPCGGPAGWQSFVLEARGWRPSATMTCSQALHSLGSTAR